MFNDGQTGGLCLGRIRMEHTVSPQQLSVGHRDFFGNSDDYVKVIGHQCIIHDLDSAEIGDLPQVFSKNFLGGVVK